MSTNRAIKNNSKRTGGLFGCFHFLVETQTAWKRLTCLPHDVRKLPCLLLFHGFWAFKDELGVDRENTTAVLLSLTTWTFAYFEQTDGEKHCEASSQSACGFISLDLRLYINLLDQLTILKDVDVAILQSERNSSHYTLIKRVLPKIIHIIVTYFNTMPRGNLQTFVSSFVSLSE